MLKNVKSGLKNLPQNCKLQLYYYFYSTQKLKDYLVVLLWVQSDWYISLSDIKINLLYEVMKTTESVLKSHSTHFIGQKLPAVQLGAQQRALGSLPSMNTNEYKKSTTCF